MTPELGQNINRRLVQSGGRSKGSHIGLRLTSGHDEIDHRVNDVIGLRVGESHGGLVYPLGGAANADR